MQPKKHLNINIINCFVFVVFKDGQTFVEQIDLKYAREIAEINCVVRVQFIVVLFCITTSLETQNINI